MIITIAYCRALWRRTRQPKSNTEFILRLFHSCHGCFVPSRLQMRSVRLVLTAQCNLRCSYCYQNAKRSVSMDRGMLRSAIDLALNSESFPVEVAFTGGEPLLELHRMSEAVRYAEGHKTQGRHIKFVLTTNGLLMTEPIAAFLDAHGFHVHLSFDGMEEAQNLRCEGTFAAMDQLLDMIRVRHLDMFEDRLQVRITVTPSTVPCLADSVDYFIRKRIRAIEVSPILTPGLGISKDFRAQLDSQFSQIYKTSLNHYMQTGRIPLLILRKAKDEKPPERSEGAMCGIVHAEGLLIDVDGSVCGCPLLACSYQDFPSDFLRQRVDALKMGDFRDPEFESRLK